MIIHEIWIEIFRFANLTLYISRLSSVFAILMRALFQRPSSTSLLLIVGCLVSPTTFGLVVLEHFSLFVNNLHKLSIDNNCFIVHPCFHHCNDNPMYNIYYSNANRHFQGYCFWQFRKLSVTREPKVEYFCSNVNEILVKRIYSLKITYLYHLGKACNFELIWHCHKSCIHLWLIFRNRNRSFLIVLHFLFLDLHKL